MPATSGFWVSALWRPSTPGDGQRKLGGRLTTLLAPHNVNSCPFVMGEPPGWLTQLLGVNLTEAIRDVKALWRCASWNSAPGLGQPGLAAHSLVQGGLEPRTAPGRPGDRAGSRLTHEPLKRGHHRGRLLR